MTIFDQQRRDNIGDSGPMSAIRHGIVNEIWAIFGAHRARFRFYRAHSIAAASLPITPILVKTRWRGTPAVESRTVGRFRQQQNGPERQVSARARSGGII